MRNTLKNIAVIFITGMVILGTTIGILYSDADKLLGGFLLVAEACLGIMIELVKIFGVI